jgi:CDP-alcohol phosphatidyltransferase
MLDGWARRIIDPPLERVGRLLAGRGASADAVTMLGLAAGLAAALSIVLRYDLAALSLFGVNRVLDGLDGAVARASRLSDRGGFLDIVADFAVYGPFRSLSPCASPAPLRCRRPSCSCPFT